jgi:apolipoprotein N-acyltransferase
MLLATAAGVVVALALPPWGFWPLSFVGVMMFELALGARPTRAQRATYGLLFGTAWYYLGMAWMVQLTAPGYLVAGLAYGGYQACAELAVPPGRWNVIGRPAAHTLAEALRFAFPFGGVPLASMGIAQVAGPLAGLARVGGVILITWVVFQIGFVAGAIVREAWRRGRRPGTTDAPDGPTPRTFEAVPLLVIPLLVVVALVVVAALAPRGSATGETLRIAAVQGGGEQGTTALEVPSRLVTERHLAATASIEPDPDLGLVLWPENTIDVVSFEDSDAYRAVAAQAARLGVPIAVGVTEDADDGARFTNAEVVVAPSGEIVARYDKVRRVPFGEYVPMRGVLEALGAPVDRIGRDAVPGTDPAYVELPDGVGLAVVISWEVFFGGRAREGVRAGGEAIVNPTNGASYTGTIVQTQQVASSRLRSIENGRWTVQAAPTGFTAVVDADGRVLQRSSISERTVLYADVELREGFTWYTNIGDAPIIVATLAVYLLALVAELRRRRRAAGGGDPLSDGTGRDLDRQRDRAVVDQLDAHVGAEAAAGHGGAGGP